VLSQLPLLKLDQFHSSQTITLHCSKSRFPSATRDKEGQSARCVECHKLSKSSDAFVKNQKAKAVKRIARVQPVLDLLNGTVPLDDSRVKQTIAPFLKVGKEYLTPQGMALQTALGHLQEYVNQRAPKTTNGAKKFIMEFGGFLDGFPQFEDTLLCDLIKNCMRRMKGQMHTKLPEAVRNLFATLYSINAKAARLISANFFGPNERNILKAQKKIDLENEELATILNRSVEDVASLVTAYVKKNFDRKDCVAVSVSIDASKIAPLIQIDVRSGKIVGGAAPNHCIELPEAQNEINAILDSFHEDKAKMKMAHEIKVATMVLQSEKKGMTPYKQLMARPQTTNENSDFNEKVCEALVMAESELRRDGYHFSFVNSANDGVSSDSKFVLDNLLLFLQGEQDHLSITDPNHNVKNARYQSEIGGNAVKTIGTELIDTGMLKKVLPLKLYRVKDFASDLLVLQLNSAESASKVLDLDNQDSTTQMTLALTLFFMRVHLFAVNCKGKLTATERVTMLWSSLIFLLHIEGVHPITKRNWMVECLGLAFLIMRADICQPHRLTSEPSEHTFAILRNMIREFTVLDFTNLIRKLDRFWISLMNGNLKAFRETRHGYGATINHHEESPRKGKEKGPVHINYKKDNPFVEAAGTGNAVSDDIWKHLKPILNKTNDGMRTFLKEALGVEKFHAMSEPFDNLDELTERLKDSMKSKKHSEGAPTAGASDVETEVEEENIGTDDAFDLHEALRNRMIKRVIRIEEGNDQSNVDETGPAELLEPVLNEFEELETEEKKVNAFTCFTRVVGITKKAELLENPLLVVDAMNEMNLGKREKGSKQGVCKFKTLLGRYFNGIVKKETKQDTEGSDDDAIKIMRGSVVALNDCPGGFFLVTVIWRVDGSKKWFPSIPEDNPNWEVGINDSNYRIGVREVDVRKGEIVYKQGIRDGLNVRQCYRQVVLSNITDLFGKVDV